MIKLISVVILTLNTTAFAQDTGPLFTSTSSNDPYTILQAAFNQAQPGSAQISDFPTLDELSSAKPSMICSEAYQFGTFTTSPTLVGQFERIISPATPAKPGAGPLIPPRPAEPPVVGTFISALVDPRQGVKARYRTKWDAYMERWGVVVEMSKSKSGDLQSTTVDLPGTDSRLLTDTFRKSGPFLFVHEVQSKSRIEITDIYAYCYPSPGLKNGE